MLSPIILYLGFIKISYIMIDSLGTVISTWLLMGRVRIN